MLAILQRIHILVICQILFVYGINADLRQCADFDQNFDFDVFSHQNQLEDVFDAFDRNDTQRMVRMLPFLESIETEKLDESNPIAYKADPIKYVPSRIRSQGYPCDVHEVVTDDGYILELHRIPYGKQSPQTDKPRPPILLMHPFLESSNSWVVLGPNHSIAYLLADAGYDVWMGNSRGTEVSRRHVRLQPSGKNQKEYWQFSLHELGFFDLATFIDHILSVTNHKKLNYIGHSQGGTVFFNLMSSRPEYNEKIIAAHLMAPAASFKVSNSELWKSLTLYYKVIKTIFATAKIYKITINNKLGTSIADIACKKATNSTPLACKLVLSIINSNQINCTSLKDILVATPAGASVRQALHYIQLERSGEFNQFDYDNKRINRIKYGRDTPPPYNLTLVTTPINIYYSKDDSLVAADNIIDLQSKLKHLKSSYVVPIDDFSHVDFIYSRYLRKAVNDELISNIDKIN